MSFIQIFPAFVLDGNLDFFWTYGSCLRQEHLTVIKIKIKIKMLRRGVNQPHAETSSAVMRDTSLLINLFHFEQLCQDTFHTEQLSGLFILFTDSTTQHVGNNANHNETLGKH